MADVVRSYEIRVSAVLDRSTAAAAGDFVQQFQRSSRAAGRAQTTEHERALRYVAGIRDRFFAEQQRKEETAQRHVARIKERYFADQQRAEERASAERERAQQREERAAERSAERKARAAERSAERKARAEARAAKKASDERKAAVREMVSDSASNMAAVASKALGVGKEIAGGLGVDFSVGRGVSKAVELEKLAVAITNAGNRGTGGEGSAMARARQPGELQTMARGLGEKYAYDPTAVLRGLAQYQALTGDLNTAKAGLESLTKLSKAFNVDLDKMIGAAGQLGSAVGEVGKDFATPEDKARVIYEILKQSTAQGQEGAIEIADLASQYAKLKAAGMRFEGGVAGNIGKMSALAQLAYQTGGAGSVREATNAVVGFANTLGTPARRAQFKAQGIDIENEKGEFLDPYKIIKQSLLKTGGDTDKMNALFKNVVGAKAVATFANAFRTAGGGDKGLAAVDAQLARFGGIVSEDTIKENLGRAMGTKESKAQQFQNRLDTIMASLADRVLPSFERLAPAVEKVVDAFASVIAWSSENPGQAIVLAIIGSIGKAVIGPMLGKAIIDMMAKGSLPSMPNGTLAYATAAIAITTATLSVMKYNEERDATKDAASKRLAETADLLKKAEEQAKTGQVDKGLLSQLAERRAEIEGLRNLGKRYDSDEAPGLATKATAGITDLAGSVTGGLVGTKGAVEDLAKMEGTGMQAKESMGALDAAAKGIDALVGGLKSGAIKATVDKIEVTVNANGSNTSGREGTPDHQ